MHVRVVRIALAAPDRQRGAPVALARERPVDVVLQPVAEAPVLDVARVPVDGLVGGQQPVAQLRGRDVPGARGVVEERVARAPAERVAVLELLGAQQQPAALEVGDEVLVGVLDEAPGVGPDALVVGPVAADGVDDRQAVALAEAEVVLAEGDRRVDEPGAVVGGHEVGRAGPCGRARRTPPPAGRGTAACSGRRRAPRPGSGRAPRPSRPRRARVRRAPRPARRARPGARSSRARTSARGRRRRRRWRRASTASWSR